ncbi:MAG: 50S ribosomal protein L30 [Candidatus Diapherotrites archaeon]|nr:50S ribosomal protein L30 [Candidatus Diapherotrites archaeon]
MAVVKVRGSIRVPQTVKDTMAMINLTRVNHCVLIDDRDTYKGMLQKAKDYITWGEVSPKSMERMLTKRGNVTDFGKYKTVEAFVEAFMKFEGELDEIHAGPVFRLSPPKKGYESTKKPFAKKGSLGNRGEAINQLLARMI